MHASGVKWKPVNWKYKDLRIDDQRVINQGTVKANGSTTADLMDFNSSQVQRATKHLVVYL